VINGSRGKPHIFSTKETRTLNKSYPGCEKNEVELGDNPKETLN
jgi:hypothetical protein